MALSIVAQNHSGRLQDLQQDSIPKTYIRHYHFLD
jgi:hypothetical protein